MLQLHQQRSIAKDFKLPLSTNDAYLLLYSAYQVEVQRVGKVLKKDEATTNVIAKVANWLTNKSGNDFGMMFCGMCGNGKSTLLRAIQNSFNWLRNNARFSIDEMNAGYDKVPIYEAKKIVTDYESRERYYNNVAILGIDDLGNEPTEIVKFGQPSNPICDLLESRYNDRLISFVTTNLTPKELRAKYGARIVDRMNETMKIVVFNHDTYR